VYGPCRLTQINDEMMMMINGRSSPEKNVNSYPFICVCIPVNYNKTANINVKKLQFNQVLTATCIE